MHAPLIRLNSQEQKKHLHKMSFALKRKAPPSNVFAASQPTPMETEPSSVQDKEMIKPAEKTPGFSLRDFLSKNYQHDVNPNFFVENPLVFDRLRKHFLPKEDGHARNTLDVAKNLLAAVCIDIRTIVNSGDPRELKRQSTRELIVIPGSLLFIVVEMLKKESKKTIHPTLQWRYQKSTAASDSEDGIVYDTLTECLDAFEKRLANRNLDINKFWLILLPGCLPSNMRGWLSQYCEDNKCIPWQHVKTRLIQKYDTHSQQLKMSCLDNLYNLRMKKTETVDEFIQKFRYLSQVTEITNEAVLCELFMKALFSKLQQCFKVYLTLISETSELDLSKAGVSIDFLMDLVRKAYYVFFTDEPIKHAGFKRPRPAHEECIFHPSTRMIHSTTDCRSLKKFK